MLTFVEETKRRDERAISALEEDELVLRIEHHLHVILAATTREGNSSVSQSARVELNVAASTHHLHTISGSFLGKMSSMYGSSAGYCSRTWARMERCSDDLTLLWVLMFSSFVNLRGERTRALAGAPKVTVSGLTRTFGT